ncbi:MAG: penicillin-binding protein 2 [bacterium]
MNRPIRRVAVAMGVLLLALVLNLNFVQVVRGNSYRSNPANSRVLLDEYSRQRGAIVVQGVPVALSVKTTDRYKYLRKYPQGTLYGPITGYYSLFYGESGMEAAESNLLNGNDPRLFGTRFADLLTGRDPRGGSVVLTLNRAAQAEAFKQLVGRRGAVVALDPATGAILAAVSTPSYDPSALSSHNPDDIERAYRKLSDDPGMPLLNRALNQTYPPGSVFKVVVAATALQNGRTPATVLAAPDRLNLPQSTTSLENFGGESCGGGGKVSLDRALTISCNTAFAKLAMDLGTLAVRNEAALFGIDDQSRTVPLPVTASTMGPVVDQAALAQSAIGQRDVRVTPLQAAMISAGVANNGVLMQPYLVAQELAPNLSVLSRATPAQLNTVMDQESAIELKRMMQNVVTNGTGTAAQIPGIDVAGKTGTADTGVACPTDTAAPDFEDTKRACAPHAWFSGFAPVEKPRIAVAVVLENGGVTGGETTGGKAAAPVAAAVMKAYLDSIGIK